jgi:hypothetical protein
MSLRRLISIAIVVMVATLPAGAQRGGMAHAGGMAAPRGGVAFRGGPAISGVRPGGAFLPRGSGFVIHDRPLASFCRGCRIIHRGFYRPGYPYWGWVGANYWPIYDWDYGDSGYTADDSYAAQLQSELADQQDVTADLAAQLNAERSRQADAYDGAQSRPAKPAAARPAQEAESPQTVLVFRDGSRTEIQNYAIVGATLYEFGAHWTKKIALTDLDIPATVKANDDRGVQFVVPAGRGS